MEAVKSAIRDAVQSKHGPCALELDASDLCIRLCIQAYQDYVIYIRPDDRHTYFLCHYAHRGDLESCADNSAEMEEWKQQRVYQMVRKIGGGLKQFVKVACNYVRDAVGRIECMKNVLGHRGFYHRIRTFEEAKIEAEIYPKPRRANPVLPPPVCKRHCHVHWAMEKEKKVRDKIKHAGQR